MGWGGVGWGGVDGVGWGGVGWGRGRARFGWDGGGVG